MNTPNLKSAIESLLFVSGEPVKLAKLAKLCNAPKNEIAAEIEKLNEEYRQGGRGFVVVQKEDIVQLATNPENSEIVNQLVSGELDSELSRAALEVLSIVAYRSPVTRAQIEAIRGVNCSYVLRSLLLRGLVERRDTADIRGYLYEISFDFLKTLGISSAKDLPDWEDLSKNEKVEELLANGQAPSSVES
jgi:segregation and condensation protein B